MAGMPLTCFNRHYAETLWLELLFWQKNLRLSWSHAKMCTLVLPCITQTQSPVIGNADAIARSVRPLPSQTQTVGGGGYSSSFVTIKCGMFTRPLLLSQVSLSFSKILFLTAVSGCILWMDVLHLGTLMPQLCN